MGDDELTRLLGPLGAEVMRVLWSAPGELPVRAVLDQLNTVRTEPLAYTTVMTVLGRLAERGAVARAAAGRGYAYRPVVRDAAELAVREVMRDHGAAAVAYFVDEARAVPDLHRRLERLLAAESPAVEEKGS